MQQLFSLKAKITFTSTGLQLNPVPAGWIGFVIVHCAKITPSSGDSVLMQKRLDIIWSVEA